MRSNLFALLKTLLIVCCAKEVKDGKNIQRFWLLERVRKSCRECINLHLVSEFVNLNSKRDALGLEVLNAAVHESDNQIHIAFSSMFSAS